MSPPINMLAGPFVFCTQASGEVASKLECPCGDRRDEPGFERDSQLAAGDAGNSGGSQGGTCRPTDGGCSYLDDAAHDRELTQEILHTPEDRLPEAAHESVAGGVGEVERGVAHIRVAVPALRRERAFRHRIGGG